MSAAESQGNTENARARVEEICQELRVLDERLAAGASAEVQLSLLQRAADLSDEAVQLLEQLSREAT